MRTTINEAPALTPKICGEASGLRVIACVVPLQQPMRRQSSHLQSSLAFVRYVLKMLLLLFSDERNNLTSIEKKFLMNRLQDLNKLQK